MVIAMTKQEHMESIGEAARRLLAKLERNRPADEKSAEIAYPAERVPVGREVGAGEASAGGSTLKPRQQSAAGGRDSGFELNAGKRSIVGANDNNHAALRSSMKAKRSPSYPSSDDEWSRAAFVQPQR